MWFTKKIKNNIGTTIFLIIILFYIVSSYYGSIKYKKNREIDFHSNYKGIIIKKYRQKGGVILFYKDLTNFNCYQINPSDELIEKCNIGDTIIKLKNSNLCLLINKNKNLKVECYFLE